MLPMTKSLLVLLLILFGNTLDSSFSKTLGIIGDYGVERPSNSENDGSRVRYALDGATKISLGSRSATLGRSASDALGDPGEDCTSNITTEHEWVDNGADSGFVRDLQNVYENRTIHDLWFNLNCDVLFKKPRPITTEDQFGQAAQLYNSIVNGTRLPIIISDVRPGLLVPVEVKHEEGKGRGIFATAPIRKGQPVKQDMIGTAVFYKAEHYRRFILDLETEMACDVLQWAYSSIDKDGKPYVAVELYEEAFCNDGGKEKGNVGCLDLGCDYQTKSFALRDIHAGEELLCIYDQFEEDVWDDLDLEDWPY